jgi:hypothetical protein
MILSNGGEILQRREKSQRQRGSEKRLTSGNRRQGSETKLTSGDRRHAGKEEAHKICGTNERRTAGLPADRTEDGKRRLIWCRNQIFEDSDGGRANSRERIRPKALTVRGGRREWVRGQEAVRGMGGASSFGVLRLRCASLRMTELRDGGLRLSGVGWLDGFRGGLLYGLEDAHVAGAAAEVAGEAFVDLGIGRVGVLG